jgi:hypothetical protein
MKTYTFYYVDDSWDQDPLEIQCGVWKGPSVVDAWLNYAEHVAGKHAAEDWCVFHSLLVCIAGDHSKNLQSEVNG